MIFLSLISANQFNLFGNGKLYLVDVYRDEDALSGFHSRIESA